MLVYAIYELIITSFETPSNEAACVKYFLHVWSVYSIYILQNHEVNQILKPSRNNFFLYIEKAEKSVDFLHGRL